MNVVILLSTYNGSLFLGAQLDSLFSQSYAPIAVLVRDDGSIDDTLEILSLYNVKLLPGYQNVGSKSSFSMLLDYALSDNQADYFMFCDQDDVWCSDKIEKTIDKMKSMEAEFGDIPLLVHTDLEVVDENLNTVAKSMWEYEYIFPNKNSLNRLLIQNTITGCTVMINRNLAYKCTNIPDDAIMHDWWIGLIASYFGKIGFIYNATIKYRQHGNNSIGAKGFKSNFMYHFPKLFKIVFVRNERYISDLKVNAEQADAFLQMFESELNDNEKKMLIEFTGLESKTFWERRFTLLRYNLFKQGCVRNIALFIKI